MDMSASSNRLVLLIAVALLLSILGMMITNDYVMDDALITLRYSYNLGQLGHPIWNEADISDRSMGYTTPLWMLLNALPAVLTDSRDVLITSARLISLVALASIIVVISKDVDRRRISASAKLAIVIGIFGQVGFAFHVNSAMETILFSCFVLLSIMAHIRYPKSAWSLVFGTLAFLTRPEGALIVALLMLDYLRSKEVFRLVTRAIVFGLFALLLVTFMVLYYGDPLDLPPDYVPVGARVEFKLAAKVLGDK